MKERTGEVESNPKTRKKKNEKKILVLFWWGVPKEFRIPLGQILNLCRCGTLECSIHDRPGHKETLVKEP